jgi:tetratricopeptide (TPR) repeat protein
MMTPLRPFKSLLVHVTRQLRERPRKEVAAATGLTLEQLRHLERGTHREPDTATVKSALEALGLRPAEVIIVSSCLDALDSLDPLADEREGAAREEAAAAAAQQVRLQWDGVASNSYPAPWQVELDRAAAREAWQAFGSLKTLKEMTLVVRTVPDYSTWAMVELLCEESIRAASKDVWRAHDLAVIAVLIAVDLPVGRRWRLFLLGYAECHLSNAYRVVGDLEAADRLLESAKHHWAAGRDPDELLDPGRLLDLEGSLRREQCRFGQSLVVLEQAAALTRRPAQVALNTAFALEVMGKYEVAIQVLLSVEPEVEAHPERRLLTIQRFNLAGCMVHAGRHREAAFLLPAIRELVGELQDDLDGIRYRWLEGRVASGLGYPEEALKALDEAREAFAERGMHYDVALCLVESLVLRLRLGSQAEIQHLARELEALFTGNGIHRRALRALMILDSALKRQEATAELAGRLLAFLFRARR